MQTNDRRQALAAAERALDTAEARGLTRVVTGGLVVKGMALGSLGRKIEGIALIEAGERIAREHG